MIMLSILMTILSSMDGYENRSFTLPWTYVFAFDELLRKELNKNLKQRFVADE